MFSFLFNSSRWVRFTLISLAYLGVFAFSHWVAFQMRFDFKVTPRYLAGEWSNCAWKFPIKLFTLLVFGQVTGLLGYFSVPDLQRILLATASSSLLIYSAKWLPGVTYWDPRGVLLVDFLLTTAGVCGVRLACRVYRERYGSDEQLEKHTRRRVAIMGAGDVGASLARELLARRGMGMEPVVFFDDDKTKWRSSIYGIPVIGPPEAIRRTNLNLRLEEVIIAMPSLPAKRFGEILKLLQSVHLKFQTVPSIDQLATGKVKISRLRSVEIQDLLGREPVKLETDNIRHLLRDRVVAVTGAGGSIGSELCRQIASFNPSLLLLIEQSEVQIFEIEQELIELGYGGTILPVVADILDEPRMRYLFNRFSPQILFHAAGHKHVPMMESQPSEAIKNNSIGTARLADLALEFGLERFVMISTDKAINPTNVMGASKRLAEIYVQALHAANPDRTKFMAVRFGNVLGSSGSVIPIFKRQIEAGGPVKVTHPDVTRYFMTIPEAVGLVLQSAAQGQGGEIFVLDMGQPVKIVDLARQLIELSGLKPEEDILIEFTGLRPGEKLFEELSYQGENYAPTNHPKILRFVAAPEPIEKVRESLNQLAADAHRLERNQLKLRLKQAVPEYQPYLV